MTIFSISAEGFASTSLFTRGQNFFLLSNLPHFTPPVPDSHTPHTSLSASCRALPREPLLLGCCCGTPWYGPRRSSDAAAASSAAPAASSSSSAPAAATRLAQHETEREAVVRKRDDLDLRGDGEVPLFAMSVRLVFAFSRDCDCATVRLRLRLRLPQLLLLLLLIHCY